MCHFDHDCGHATCHECHTVMQLLMLPYREESNAAHVAYALVPSILCTRQQQCMMQLMPCMWSAMHLHEPVPYCVMLNAVLQCMSHVSSAALPCRLLPCVCCRPLAGAASAARRRMALHSPTTRGRTEPAETSVCAPRVQPRRPRQLQSQFGDCSSGASPALPSPMERR